MNVQNTEAWNVFRERSEQGVSAVRSSLAQGSHISSRRGLALAFNYGLAKPIADVY